MGDNDTNRPISTEMMMMIACVALRFVTSYETRVSLAADAPESATGYSTTRVEMEVPMKCERHHNLANYGA
eukprot:scaffold163652_cov36-Cyclotella_meneghiniana.AAC.2